MVKPGSEASSEQEVKVMAWESALGSVIEVAIALVGFSGIVAAVGRRGA